MTAADWERVGEARLPLAALPALAPLRDRPDVRVTTAGGVAWVRWSGGRPDVLAALLAVAGTTFFRIEGGVRFPVGSRLPAADAPPGEDRPLASALVPAVAPARQPGGAAPRIPLSLVRGGEPAPATALVCPLGSLRGWADAATTAELAAVSGLLGGDRAALFGETLPGLPDATRFHGADVLVPVGYRLDPPLPAAVVRAAAGASAGNVVLLTADGSDLLPRHRAEPLTRAGVRLALAGRTS